MAEQILVEKQIQIHLFNLMVGHTLQLLLLTYLLLMLALMEQALLV